MTAITTNAATIEYILFLVGKTNDELRMLLGNEEYFVVGLDGERNIVFLNKEDVSTETTIEIPLDNYRGLMEIESDLYRLIPKTEETVVFNCTTHTPSGCNEEDGLELPFYVLSNSM